MKTLLGIVASPRKRGNSELAIHRISDGVAEPHRLRLLRIQDFNIQSCRGCYQCLLRDSGCVLRDDFNDLVQAMAEADAWVFAVPTYCLGANAALKTLVDRGLGFHPFAKELWNKPAVGVTLAGMEGKEGYAKLMVDSAMRLLMAKAKGSVILNAALPGEVLLKEENLAVLDRLGRALLGDPIPLEGPRCPLCGGDTFRFLDRDTVRCMTCSNAGPFRAPDGNPEFDIRHSGHDLFLTETDQHAHKAWLTDMKNRFLANKDALKAVTLPYKGRAERVLPPQRDAKNP